MITKKPENITNFRMNCCFFESARKAFAHVLHQHSSRILLIPAYIGYSSREGSGVFDPIRESGIKYCFYKMDKELYVEMGDLRERLLENKEGVLLIIHYFGFIDPNYSEVKKLAKDLGYIIVEDYAHGLFTFFYGGGRDFDYAFFSLHKMLPYSRGGMLLSKCPQKPGTMENYNLLEYDFYEIAQRRCQNYYTLKKLLEPLCAHYHIHFLRDNLGNAVPQTFPMLLSDAKTRDRVYFGLNEIGYGVVGLYHELIPEINSSYEEAHYLSSRILNLPIHQDANIDELEAMTWNLGKLLYQNV